MPRIALTIRVARAVIARLREKSERARLPPASYASRLLENALVGGMPVVDSRLEIPPAIAEVALTELFYISSALAKFLGKQPGLVEDLRSAAEVRATEVMRSQSAAAS